MKRQAQAETMRKSKNAENGVAEPMLVYYKVVLIEGLGLWLLLVVVVGVVKLGV